MSQVEPGLSREDSITLDALRRGDEETFVALVARHHSALGRMALLHVTSAQVAEEVVQDTWIGLLESLDRFEQRSSLKTWIFRILLNRARNRACSERRSAPFSAFAGEDEATSAGSDRFLDQRPEHADRWVSISTGRPDLPEEELLSREISVAVDEAIAQLPPRQRDVITLRDVGGCSAAESCLALSLTEANERVLLHRARSSVRVALHGYLQNEDG